jgi:hypothetical protein
VSLRISAKVLFSHRFRKEQIKDVKNKYNKQGNRELQRVDPERPFRRVGKDLIGVVGVSHGRTFLPAAANGEG